MFRLIISAFSLSALLLGSSAAQASLDLPDPTRPGNYLVPTSVSLELDTNGFKLHSLLVSSHRRLAVINEISVEEGDFVNGATVKQIDKNRVVLEQQGRSFSLSLAERDFKQRK